MSLYTISDHIPAEGEAVSGVVTEELLLAGGHQGHGGARLVRVGAGHVPHVGHGEGGEGPLEGAVTQERIAGHQEHLSRTCRQDCQTHRHRHQHHQHPHHPQHPRLVLVKLGLLTRLCQLLEISIKRTAQTKIR